MGRSDLLQLDRSYTITQYMPVSRQYRKVTQLTLGGKSTTRRAV